MSLKPLLLAVALVPLLIAAAHPAEDDPPLDARFKEISDGLICQCGCNLMLSVCSHEGCGSALPMRAEIRRKLAAGDSDDAIVTSFVDQYGLVVLSAPPTTGFNLTAWIMPVVVLVAGAWVAKSVLGSWRRQTVQGEAGAPGKPGKPGKLVKEGEEGAEPDPVSAEQQARVERELRDFEA